MNLCLLSDAGRARPDSRRYARPSLRPLKGSIFPRIDRAAALLPQAAALLPHAAALAVLLIVLSAAGGARAACDPDPPSDDDAIVCTGTDETGYDATGATNLTITTSGVVTMNDSSALDAAIAVGDDNVVDLEFSTITVTEANGAGVRAGNDNTVSNGGTIIVDGANGAGIAGGDDNAVTTSGTIVVNGSNGVAIDVGNANLLDSSGFTDDRAVTNSGSITINATGGIGFRAIQNYDLRNTSSGTIFLDAAATGGVAIWGQDDNVINQQGTITVDAANAWAVRTGNNTGFSLPNGAIFSSASRTIINGDDSVALEIGDNAGTSLQGQIDLNGNRTFGAIIGDRTDTAIPANHTQGGTLTINGDDAFGIRAGDGWLEYDTLDNPTAGGIRNQGRINVFGARSVGVFAGDDGNTNFNHDSFVVNTGTIDVRGTDATGLSLGGNDLLDRWDLADPSANLSLFTLSNGGTILGDADAGPLVVFRNFVVGRENRILNSGTIRANLANLGATDRGIAIRGTGGDEIFFDNGTLRGDVEFLGGDDRYVVGGDAVYEGGTIDGGTGTDEITLGLTNAIQNFDVGNTTGFESLRIDGRSSQNGSPIGWRIENGASFTGDIQIIENGRLAAPSNLDGTTAEVVLAGDLSIDPLGSVLVAPDGSTTVPLTLTSATPTTLDGSLIVAPTDLLTTAGTYRLIEISAGRGTSEFTSINVPDTLGLLSLATTYDATGLDLDVTASLTFAGVATSANRSAIATYIDALEADGSTQMAIADQIAELRGSRGNLNETFDALDPTGYDAQTQMIAESSRRIAHLLFDRPRQCRTGDLDDWQDADTPLDCHSGRLAAWASAIGSLRDRNAHSGQPEYDSQIGGIVLGLDLEPIGGIDLTAAASIQRGTVDVKNVGESDLVLANLTAAASWRSGGWRVQGAATYGFGSHNDRRAFVIDESATTISAGAKNDHTSHHIGLSAEAGYLFDLGPVRIEPIAALDYVWISQESLREGNAGIWGLRIDQRDDSVLFGSAGLRLSTVYDHTAYLADRLVWVDGVWRPSVDVRWRQMLVGAERDIGAGLIGAPDTVGGFTVQGKEDAGGVDVGVGVTFEPKHANRLQIQFRYDLFAGPETLQHDLVAKLRFGF